MVDLSPAFNLQNADRQRQFSDAPVAADEAARKTCAARRFPFPISREPPARLACHWNVTSKNFPPLSKTTFTGFSMTNRWSDFLSFHCSKPVTPAWQSGNSRN